MAPYSPRIKHILIVLLVAFPFAHKGFCQDVNPSSAQARALTTAAIVAANNGQVNQALEIFNKIINSGQDQPRARYNRGKLLFLLGKNKQAIKDFTIAAKSEDFEPQALGMRARAFLKEGSRDQAFKDLTKALKKDPDDNHIRFERIRLYLELGQPEIALSDLDEFLKRNRGSISGLGCRGVLLRRLGKYRSAKRDFLRILSIDKHNVDAMRHMAYISIQLGRNGEASKWLKAALEHENRELYKQRIINEIKHITDSDSNRTRQTISSR